jgi:hypothetical protein
MLKSGQVVEASGYKGAKSNIAFSGTASGGKKEFGTNLIHDLSSNQKHTVTIRQGSEANNTIDFLPTNENYRNAQDPNVGSGGTLRYDPESTGRNILNKDGTRGINAYIQLGHELIHSDNAMKGKMKSIKEGNTTDPDYRDGNWNFYLSPEEILTRKFENIIRRENKEKLRAEP